MDIGLSPFQRGLIRAVLERYQTDRKENAAFAAEPDTCLWMDWRTGSISMSERPGFSPFPCASSDRRPALIDSLRKERVIILP